MRGRTLWTLLASALLLLAATTTIIVFWPEAQQAGGLPPPGTVTPAPNTPSATLSPTPSDEEQVIAVYTRYTTVIWEARLGPEEDRRALLSPVVADPYLTTLVENMRLQEEDGYTLWGKPSIVLSANASIRGNDAHVYACLDSSRGGQADTATGEHVTVGPPRNPVQVVMTRKSEETWKVLDIIFPGGQCQ